MAISSPNYTQYPNEILDEWQGRLKPVEFCVLSYIVRHTFGWDGKPYAITYKEFIHGMFDSEGNRIDQGCGVKSSATIKAALDTLAGHDLIERIPTKTERGAVDASGYQVKVVSAAAVRLRAVSGASRTKAPALQVVKRRYFTEQSASTSGSEAPSISIKETDERNKEKEQGTGADAPRAGKPRRPSLKQDQPDIWRQREAIREAYTALSGQARNKWTNADCEALARDYGAEDSIATLTAMWDVQWANGRYPYRSPLKLSTAHELVPAWRRGELRSDPPPARSVGKTTDPARMGAGMGGQLFDLGDLPPACRCSVRVGGQHWTSRCGRRGMVTEEDCRG